MESTAVQLLTDTIQNSADKVTLLTLGPLTNVAEAFQATPTLIENLEMIYVMGGAFNVPGNVQASGVGINNDVAEWNMYVDPQAAALVIQSGAPLTFIPLDATNHVPLTINFYRKLEQEHGTPVADFAYQVLTSNLGFINSGGYYFWDPLAGAILSDESLATIEEHPAAIIGGEGSNSGQTIIDEKGNPVRIAVDADSSEFETIFLNVLNGQSPPDKVPQG